MKRMISNVLVPDSILCQVRMTPLVTRNHLKLQKVCITTERIMGPTITDRSVTNNLNLVESSPFQGRKVSCKFSYEK